MNGADALLKSLENHDVKRIFSYPGGTVLPIFDRMPKYNIKRILNRHEQGAAFAAAGVSRSTDKVGVCLATSGPGATNLLTGIADAFKDSIPMIAITGNVPTALINTNAFQEVDIVQMAQPITKKATLAKCADEIPELIEEAFQLAQSGKPGPVLIDIPKDVQMALVSDDVIEKLKNKKVVQYEKGDSQVDITQLSKVIEILQQSQKPVAIFGHGVKLSKAEKELAEFLEKSQIPTVWTLHGIGSFDPQHELSFGMLGMHGLGEANHAVHNADVVIGIGMRFDDRIIGTVDAFEKNKKIIHFDIDPLEFGKIIKCDARVQGDLKTTLPALINQITELETKSWLNELTEYKQAHPICENKKSQTEISVLNELYKIIDQEAIVTVDVGQHEMWAAQRFPGKLPKKFLASGGLGTMGFSLPTAVGAAFSGFETWSISGDGGFQMNIQELATIAQHKLPIRIMILNNSFLGMVSMAGTFL